jgi:GNAT superfamily N-acetyltransferase
MDRDRIPEGIHGAVPLTIRRALPSEAAALTSLVLRSKAHWGYDEAFMHAAIPELTITPALLETMTAFVAERDDGLLGFYVLGPEDGVPTLRDMWVEPSAMRTGVGRALWGHLLEQARALGHRTLHIESDPNAEAFYVKMGARRVGQVASKIMPGRMLPSMEVEVEG